MLTLLRYGWRVARGSTAIVVALAVADAVAQALFTLTIGLVVAAVPAYLAGTTDRAAMVALFAAFAALFLLTKVLPTLQATSAHRLGNVAGLDVYIRMAGPMAGGARVAHVEDPAVLDQAERAAGTGGYQITWSLGRVPDLLGARLTVLSSAILLGVLTEWWLAAALVLLVLVAERWRVRFVRDEVAAWATNTESERKALYPFELALGDAPTELRVFGLRDWLVRRYLRYWTSAMTELWRSRRRGYLIGSAPLVLSVLVNAAAVAWVIVAAQSGRLGLAAVASAITAILAISGSGTPEIAALVARGVAAYRAMLELPAVIAERHPHPAGPAADLGRAPARCIRLERVGFRYPGSERDVFTDLDLEIRAGEALGLVGVNGAGKTTLTKLIAGVYPPTSGRVLVDGVDLATLGPEDLARWQRQVAPIIQEFARYPLSLDDNVALGARRPLTDADRARVAERSGVADLLPDLDLGWDTVLDKEWVGGTDLSAGQWQRVALARALFAVDCGAKMLILDEPAAALDVRAEARLVDQYLNLTAGITSMIISHRFSVVRDADRICVLDAGRIVESGTHPELILQQGAYARMFGLQAARYTGTGAVGDE
ncbi:ATP-binding cassette domain-containing protein [Microlunatus sp. GCM10028923]|uniref:ATP-binding cassette domain-containing protein n=1 Tax=Microlunatus sp. GCM10028923 TaxID=3273400 RepID=UPI00360CFCCC